MDKFVNRFQSIERVVRRKLHAALRIEDLRVPLGNRLEALRGDRAGQWRSAFRSDSPWRNPRRRVQKPLGISINRLSRELHVPPNRIHAIVHGQRTITADKAPRLGVFFGVTPETRLSLLAECDLLVARGDRENGAKTRSGVIPSRLTTPRPENAADRMASAARDAQAPASGRVGL